MTKDRTVTQPGPKCTSTCHKPHSTSEQLYSSPKYTSEEHYKHPHYTPAESYKSPKYISKKSYESPSSKTYEHPKYTSKEQYEQPHHTSSASHNPPKYTSVKPYNTLKYTSEHSHTASAKYTSQMPKYSHASPKYTSANDYARPPLPSYRPARRSSYSARQAKSHDHCKSRIVEPEQGKLALSNNTHDMARQIHTTISTTPLATIMRREGLKNRMATSAVSNPTPLASVPALGSKEKICMPDLCRHFRLSKHDCQEFVEYLEKEAKDNKVDIEFTSDEEVCAKSSGSVKARTASIAAQHLNNISMKVSRSMNMTGITMLPRRSSICSYCHPAVPNATCSEVQEMIGAVFHLRNIDPEGYDSDFWEYSSECQERNEPSRTHHGKHAVCIQSMCSELNYGNKDCEKLEDELEGAWKKKFGKRLDYEVDYTTDDDVCGKY